ncbi:hypothetical protein [Actomonas aquatica]|uniref:Uncharacterized protein n=1 Tax=Actomonas aquatica TaxID=2866162 RepID=A0ABZ1C5R6_9BACT|nr:hypothetical protein [Opitutus sp. WL0086]WRQ87074.1 hypothetical protein K1X11_019845 [Opitutus sp. WL0086]
MWSKLKEQLPAIVLTILLIGGLAYWLHTETVRQMSAQQDAELVALREQTQAQLQAAAAETRQQIDEMNTFLRDAIKSRQSDLLLSDEEFASAQQTRVDQIAAAVADRIQPYGQLPQSAAEAAQQEDAQIERVSDRLTDRIRPLLAQLSDDQAANRVILERISEEISNQLSVVLTSELAKNQTLNNNLAESQAIARDSLGLSQELAALYLSSFEDKGILTRILTLPAGVIKDASQLSIVNSRERAKKEEELLGRLAEFQTRLEELQAKAPGSVD